MKMLEICFVTGNKSKFLEAASVLKTTGIRVVQKDLELVEPRGESQEEVVKEKARQAFENVGSPVMVDDTGIYFNAFENFPGTYTKFLINKIGYDGINRLLSGLDRTAYFQTSVCYYDGKEFRVFSGRWEGTIKDSPSKTINPDWSYNSIFIPTGYDIPLSEISDEERMKKSHRAKALAKLLKYFGGVRK